MLPNGKTVYLNEYHEGDDSSVTSATMSVGDPVTAANTMANAGTRVGVRAGTTGANRTAGLTGTAALTGTSSSKGFNSSANTTKKVKYVAEADQLVTAPDDLRFLQGVDQTAGGVCIGDSLQQTAHRSGGTRVEKAGGHQHSSNLSEAEKEWKAKHDTHIAAHDQATALDLQSIVSYEDMFALNLDSGKWVKLCCRLAPLPRRGHSLLTALVNTSASRVSNSHPHQTSAASMAKPPLSPSGKSSLFGSMNQHTGVQVDTHEECLILFGGFSRENEAYSNTVHICTTESVQEVLENPCLNTPNASSITWRILQTTGIPPCARYRHTATLVRTSGYTHSLVIMGGIAKGARPLNDIFALNLTSLVWTRMNPESPEQLLTWPTPIFGHVAFAVSVNDYGESMAEDLIDDEANDRLMKSGGFGAGASSGAAKRKAKAREIMEKHELVLAAMKGSGSTGDFDAKWNEMLIIYGGYGAVSDDNRGGGSGSSSRGGKVKKSSAKERNALGETPLSHPDLTHKAKIANTNTNTNANANASASESAKLSKKKKKKNQLATDIGSKPGDVIEIPGDSDDSSLSDDEGAGIGVNNKTKRRKKYQTLSSRQEAARNCTCEIVYF